MAKSLQRSVPRTGPQDREESPSERADRNVVEIVQELRVAQTGVQILFGFLLSLAFVASLPREPVFTRVLTAAVLCSAAASACFMGPVAYHRLHFRQGRKECLVWVGHWMAIAGLGFLVVAMDLAIWLVLAHLWDQRAATVSSLVLLAAIPVLWFVVPRAITGLERTGRDDPDASQLERVDAGG